MLVKHELIPHHTFISSVTVHPRSRAIVHFKDKQTHKYLTNQLLSAAHLSPCDVISVHVTKQTFEWAIILEYLAKQDCFLVAMSGGRILRYAFVVFTDKTV